MSTFSLPERVSSVIHAKLEGLGYVPPFTGSKNLRDAEHGVRIEFLIAGEFPGDGKPKPVAFPEPDDVGVVIDGIRFLSLPKLVELKLASGMTGGLHRMKDFADVIALIQTLHLSADFADRAKPLRPRQVPRALAWRPGFAGRAGRALARLRNSMSRKQRFLVENKIVAPIGLDTEGV